MPKIGAVVFAVSLLIISNSTFVSAGNSSSPAPVQQPPSPEFLQIKTLVGSWEGTHSTEGKPEPVSVKYKLTSGGTAIVETLFPGTPKEMVSVYYDQDGKLQMTHYCMLGNQPRMAVDQANSQNLKFNLIENSGINVGKDPHMHALNIEFKDKDHIIQKWTMYENGKSKEPGIIELERK